MIPTENTHLVLIADDNDFNRDGLALYLRGYGYQTLEAGDAETAYELAAAHRPDSAVVAPSSPAGARNACQASHAR